MTITCYHAIDPHWPSPMAVSPADFERHCAWLARHRTVLPLQEAIGRLDSSYRLPRGLAAMTFDDGFSDLYDHALPVLRRFALPATVFLVAQTLTQGGREVDWVNFPPPYRLRTLDREQVLEMQAAGISFQSHSWAHHDLTTLDPGCCIEDLRDSRELLEDLLRTPVTMLAYPQGRHDDGVRHAAAVAGYTHAFALPEHAESVGSFAIPRVGVHRGNSVTTLRAKCSRQYLPLRLGRVARLARPLRSALRGIRSA